MTKNIIKKDSRRICESVDLSSLDGSTILITGASGLIGTYIVACLSELIEQGYKFKAYAHHFNELPLHLRSFIVKNTIMPLRLDLSTSRSYTKLQNADFIIHSAGYAQPSLFMKNPAATLKINTAATWALLEKLNNNGRFLFISSSEVYSGLNKPFLNERDIGTTTPMHTRASYIEGKRMGETIVNILRSGGVNAKSARVSLAYGPGTKRHDTRALNSFIEKALTKKKIEMLDSGNAIRTYCYVSDIVEILWHILLCGKKPVYNVGGKSIISIAELAKEIGSILNVPVIFPKSGTEIAGSPKTVQLDLSKVESEFGKTEFVSLKEGLAATIKWQKNLYDKHSTIN